MKIYSLLISKISLAILSLGLAGLSLGEVDQIVFSISSSSPSWTFQNFQFTGAQVSAGSQTLQLTNFGSGVITGKFDIQNSTQGLTYTYTYNSATHPTLSSPSGSLKCQLFPSPSIYIFSCS